MTLHDMAMTRFGQWWWRCVRTGYGYADGMRLHGKPPERTFCARRPQHSVLGIRRAACHPILAWPTRGASLILLGGYFLLYWRIRRYGARRGWPALDARLMPSGASLAKFPMLAGLVIYWFRQITSRPKRLIEYKGPGEADSDRELVSIISRRAIEWEQLIDRSMSDSWEPATSPIGMPRLCGQSLAPSLPPFATVTQARVQAFAARYGVTRVHTSLDAMLSDGRLDVIHVLLPPELHCQTAAEVIVMPASMSCSKNRWPPASGVRKSHRACPVEGSQNRCQPQLPVRADLRTLKRI